MITVRGKIERGKVLVLEPIADEFEGREVQITLLENQNGKKHNQSYAEADEGWRILLEGIERSRINTGIGDLAHQHDHYLYGTPKRD